MNQLMIRSLLFILFVIFVCLNVPVLSAEQSLPDQVTSPFKLMFNGVMDIKYDTLNMGESKSWAYIYRDGYYSMEWIISPITPTTFHVIITRNCDSLKESCDPLFEGSVPGTVMPIGIATDSPFDTYYVTITAEDGDGEYSIYMRSYKSMNEEKALEPIPTLKPRITPTVTVNDRPSSSVGVPTNL